MMMCAIYVPTYLLFRYQYTCGIGLPTISIGKVNDFPSTATYSSESDFITGFAIWSG